MSAVWVPVAACHVKRLLLRETHHNIKSPIVTDVQDSEKLRKIRSIWGSDRGVVSLHVYNNAIAEEAFTREAVMISCIGEL